MVKTSRKRTLKSQIRNEFRFIGPHDKIVIFRNPHDILFGTFQIERINNEIIVTGVPKSKKKNNGRAKFFKVIKDSLKDEVKEQLGIK